jgi:hypothetical protein
LKKKKPQNQYVIQNVSLKISKKFWMIFFWLAGWNIIIIMVRCCVPSLLDEVQTGPNWDPLVYYFPFLSEKWENRNRQNIRTHKHKKYILSFLFHLG